jgi:polyferredoxin
LEEKIEKQKSKKPKNKKKKKLYLRMGIQLLFFIAAPSAFAAGFSGVKYIGNQLGKGESLQFTSFLVVFLMLCIFTIIFGRFFCGYACAFGTLGDVVYGIAQKAQKRRKRKLPTLPVKLTKVLRYIKYVILFAIFFLCFMGIYGSFMGTSPWDVFSMITIGNFKLSAYVAGIIILVGIIIGMVFQERFFCQFLCPLGAVFAILPMIPFVNLRRNREQCIRKCTACEKKCPMHLQIDGDTVESGECIQCGKCIDTCPKSNIRTGISRIYGNEILVSIVKAALLMGLCFYFGLTRI